jgi:hypothetical protein
LDVWLGRHEPGAVTTFVLVPGMCHGGWCFDDLAVDLRAAGHEVRALTLTSVGDPQRPPDPDVGYAWQPDPAPGLATLCTARERLVVVVAADDELAGAVAVDPAALSGRPLALVPRRSNPWVHDHYVRELTARGARVTVARQDAVRLDRLLPLVLAGTAIGVTTERAAAGVAGTGAVARPLAGDPLLVEHHLLWRADTTDAAVLALVDVVRGLVAEGAFSG